MFFSRPYFYGAPQQYTSAVSGVEGGSASWNASLSFVYVDSLSGENHASSVSLLFGLMASVVFVQSLIQDIHRQGSSVQHHQSDQSLFVHLLPVLFQHLLSERQRGYHVSRGKPGFLFNLSISPIPYGIV